VSTSQWFPAICEGTTPVEPDKTPEEGYHFTDDMTTKAIKWVRQQKSLMPDKPFFIYYAPGATHAPHHVPSALEKEMPPPSNARARCRR
jgi:arylsulfatase